VFAAAPSALLWLALAQVPAAPAPAVAQATDTATPKPALKPPAEVKAAFLKLLDRPRVPLDVKAEPPNSDTTTGLVSERLSFASEAKPDGTTERVPVLVVRFAPTGAGRRPAVIVLHGTGGSKDTMKPWLNELARRGFVAVAIDARYHGDRAGGARGSAAYVGAITRAWRSKTGETQEHPFYYDTCWDLWRTLDYLQTRDDVDPKRVGMLGTSMGGIETWLAGAADDRVAVAVPAIGVQSFRWSLENEAWQGRANTIKAAHEAAAEDLGEPKVNSRVCRKLWGKVVPGILDDFDCPSMLRLFATRPLLILNGERDPNCPVGGARVAVAAAEAAYKDAGATDRLKVDVAEGVGHAVTPDQRREALDWFERWLKPSP
jgi:dienelactone hydrolase